MFDQENSRQEMIQRPNKIVSKPTFLFVECRIRRFVQRVPGFQSQAESSFDTGAEEGEGSGYRGRFPFLWLGWSLSCAQGRVVFTDELL